MMRPTLKALLRLQEMDAKLATLSAEKEELPRQLQAHQQLVTQQQADLDREREHTRQLQHEVDQRDHTLRNTQAKINQLKTHLNQIKTNKEYATLLAEIKDNEMDNSKLEDEVLLTLDELDKAREGSAKLEEHLEAEKSKYQDLYAQTRQRQVELDKMITQLDDTREKLAETIPFEELAVYERVRQALGARAIVGLVDGICQGCNMPVAPQIANLVLADRDLIRCHHCQRILYIKPSPEEEKE